MPVIVDEHTQYTDVDGKPFLNGKIFIGIVNLDPEANPEPIFSNRELTIVLANPQTLNSRGQSPTKIYSAGRYSFKLENSAGSQIEQDLDRGENVASQGALILGNVAGINTITATADPTIVAYVDKQQYVFTAASTNTGSVTLNIDSIGAKSIKEQGSELSPGRIAANAVVLVIFNSTLDLFDLINGLVATGRGALVYKSANQVITTSVKTVLSFNLEDFDTDAIHDNSTNNSRLTVPAGVTKVQLNTNIEWASGTGRRESAIIKNGSAFIGRGEMVTPAVSGSTTSYSILSSVVVVVAGDFFEVEVFQTSGGNLNVQADSGQATWFNMDIIK